MLNNLMCRQIQLDQAMGHVCAGEERASRLLARLTECTASVQQTLVHTLLVGVDCGEQGRAVFVYKPVDARS